jgi:CRISPR-associated protein Cas1
MPGRIIDISQDQRHLALHRGFLVISHQHEELGRVPIDDLEAVIACGHGITHSSNLLAALSERGIPFVLCASNHSPVGMLLSVDGNYQQGKRLAAQAAAKRPLQKRLWQQLVRAKLLHQAEVLETLGQPKAPLATLVAKVRSGDPDNIEAQGARRYWSLLFGSVFRRDRNADDHNRMLNYGYAILRSGVARGVVAAGLHPGLGLHHRNGYNPMCLVDDLIEPWRPLIDLRVKTLLDAGCTEVDSDTKRRLADVLYTDLALPDGCSPVISVIQSLATSLAQVYLEERASLSLPGGIDAGARNALCRLP